MEQEISPRRQIRNFILVILLGIACGLGAVVYLVNAYGPSGGYKLRNVLLAPSILQDLWYSSPNPKTGGNARFIFKDIEFEKMGEKPILVDEGKYQQFYEKVQGDKSLVDPQEADLLPFDQLKSRLKINVKTESDAKWQARTEIFQEVQFAKDTYRVELREDNPGSHWAIFHHPGIEKEAEQLFSP